MANMVKWIRDELALQAEQTGSDFDAAFDAVLAALCHNLYEPALMPEDRDAAIRFMTEHETARLAFDTMFRLDRAFKEGRDCCVYSLQDRLDLYRDDLPIPEEYFGVLVG